MPGAQKVIHLGPGYYVPRPPKPPKPKPKPKPRPPWWHLSKRQQLYLRLLHGLKKDEVLILEGKPSAAYTFRKHIKAQYPEGEVVVRCWGKLGENRFRWLVYRRTKAFQDYLEERKAARKYWREVRLQGRRHLEEKSQGVPPLVKAGQARKVSH